jgi:ribosomal protein S15P/S13E
VFSPSRHATEAVNPSVDADVQGALLSPLTKLFVILLVIVSMLNAAAIVVFVNKARPLQKTIDDDHAMISAYQSQADAANAAREQAVSAYQSAMLRAEDDRKNSVAANTQLQTSVNDARITIARMEADATNLQAALNTAVANSQLSTATAAKLQEQVTALRNTNDQLAKENQESSTQIATLTSTLENLHNHSDAAQEELVQAKQERQMLAAFIKDKGFDPDQIVRQASPYGPATAAINGVVRDKSVINGNTFVTISVGSADGVVKGMKFYVVNGGDFLGIITIDTVDTDNAIGRLDGEPSKTSLVQRGNDVKTQLRS